MVEVKPGDRYHRWTVLRLAPSRAGKRMALCRCDCGTERVIQLGSLRSGSTRSCGCLLRERAAARAHDITGQRFGRLVAVSREPDGMWLCQCDCGQKTRVRITSLRRMAITSCGCMKGRPFTPEELRAGTQKLAAHRVDGTCILSLKIEKPNRNSITGVRGVSPAKGGRFRASIMLRGKSKHIGTYGTIEEARKARERAVEELHQPIIEKWENDRKD